MCAMCNALTTWRIPFIQPRPVLPAKPVSGVDTSSGTSLHYVIIAPALSLSSSSSCNLWQKSDGSAGTRPPYMGLNFRLKTAPAVASFCSFLHCPGSLVGVQIPQISKLFVALPLPEAHIHHTSLHMKWNSYLS